VAIQLQLGGESGTRCGAQAAGVAALVEGWRAVSEGRCDVVICGAADSAVDPGGARALVRLGCVGADRAPGEGAAMLRLERADRAQERGATVLGRVMGGGTRFVGPGPDPVSPRESLWGRCGSAAMVMDAVVDIAVGRRGRVAVSERYGASAHFAWA